LKVIAFARSPVIPNTMLGMPIDTVADATAVTIAVTAAFGT
jgi:hypothetical protein